MATSVRVQKSTGAPMTICCYMLRSIAGRNQAASTMVSSPGSRQAPSTPISRSGKRRSEEHTSELQSLMRISYAVFCLKKKINHKNSLHHDYITIHCNRH